MSKNKYTENRNIVFAFLLVLLFVPIRSIAITKQNADDCYKKGDYQQAIADYQDLLKHGISADIYYNLGNAYYRSDNLAKAILCYERASLISPGDKDIRFNLQLANSKTIDKITPVDENVFVTWYDSIVNLTSMDSWARISILCIIVALLLMLVYLFAISVKIRKIGFFGSIAFMAVFLVSTLFAWQQKFDLQSRNGAIIMAPSISIKSSPTNNSSDSFVLHEGTKVNIIDNSMKGWKAIQVGDGREGWIKSSAIEFI